MRVALPLAADRYVATPASHSTMVGRLQQASSGGGSGTGVLTSGFTSASGAAVVPSPTTPAATTTTSPNWSTTVPDSAPSGGNTTVTGTLSRRDIGWGVRDILYRLGRIQRLYQLYMSPG